MDSWSIFVQILPFEKRIVKATAKTSYAITRISDFYHYRAKLLRADWLRERAFFVNQGHFW